MCFKTKDNVVKIKSLSKSEKTVLKYLSLRLSNKLGYAFPGLPTICIKTNLSRATVYRSIKSLKEKNLVQSIAIEGINPVCYVINKELISEMAFKESQRKQFVLDESTISWGNETSIETVDETDITHFETMSETQNMTFTNENYNEINSMKEFDTSHILFILSLYSFYILESQKTLLKESKIKESVETRKNIINYPLTNEKINRLEKMNKLPINQKSVKELLGMVEKRPKHKSKNLHVSYAKSYTTKVNQEFDRKDVISGRDIGMMKSIFSKAKDVDLDPMTCLDYFLSEFDDFKSWYLATQDEEIFASSPTIGLAARYISDIFTYFHARDSYFVKQVKKPEAEIQKEDDQAKAIDQNASEIIDSKTEQEKIDKILEEMEQNLFNEKFGTGTK